MAERDSYVRKAKEQIEEWNAEIGRLQAEMRADHADANLVRQQQLDEMRQHRGEAEDALARMEAADWDDWESAKWEFERAWAEVDAGFEHARRITG